MSGLNTNTDLAEEDAADLQFPKDITFHRSNILNYINKCFNCENELTSPFILCARCDVHLCSICFANGAEFDKHKNDHPYKIMKNDFNLFENTDWAAKEEIELLDGILVYNNWHAISKHLNRPPLEIQEHFERFYLNKSNHFMNLQINTDINYVMITPYRFRLNNIQDPIRTLENAPAGYNSARSDFEYDYNKNAEEMISRLEMVDPMDPFHAPLSELQVGIFNAYNRKLKERQHRKRIIREHGLIMPQKTTAWLHRYASTITPAVCEKLIRFMQFYTGQGFEYMMEGLHRVGELKLQIARLCEYRKRGIKTLEEAQLYLKLKKHREESLKGLKRYQDISELSVKLKNIPVPIPSTGSKRRSMTPLEILGMPGYEKLLDKEKELCRNVRLPPLNYIEMKAILIAENNKLGYLRLLTARRLLKIDVNKTRKLYDFLIQEGYVNKPKDASQK